MELGQPRDKINTQPQAKWTEYTISLETNPPIKRLNYEFIFIMSPTFRLFYSGAMKNKTNLLKAKPIGRGN